MSIENAHLTTPTHTAAMSTVSAELVFTIASRAPEVELSFSGLDPPTLLFEGLQKIGWEIPSIPPPPGTAIDWTPDRTTGLDYTILPWTVNEFRLIPTPDWSADEERDVGTLTIRTLQQYRVAITGLRGRPVEDTPAGVKASAPAGKAVCVVLAPANLDSPAGMTSWPAKAGRRREEWSWHEGPSIDAETVSALLESEAFVWSTMDDSRPETSAGMTTIQMISTSGGSAKELAKLEKLFGAPPHSIELQGPGGAAGALLITVQVPANSVEIMKSNLFLRFPKMILRD